MKPIVVATLALVLGTALLAGCKGEEPAAPAAVAEPAAPPAPAEPVAPAEPMVETPSPTEGTMDPAMPDPNAADPEAAPADGETMDEETDTPHSGGDKV